MVLVLLLVCVKKGAKIVSWRMSGNGVRLTTTTKRVKLVPLMKTNLLRLYAYTP